MRASDFGGAGGAIDLGDDLVAAFREADAFGIQPDIDALELDDVLDRRRHVLVLAANEPRRHFNDRYLAAKAAVHLAEFEADIAAADNDEMVRQKIDVHHRRIRQVGDRPRTSGNSSFAPIIAVHRGAELSRNLPFV